MKQCFILLVLITFSSFYFDYDNFILESTIKEGKKSKDKFDEVKRNELYESILILDKVYKNCNKTIFYSKPLGGYNWHGNNEESNETVLISDSIRLRLINESLKSKQLRSVLTSNFYDKICSLADSLDDPINLGFLITNHKLGETLMSILSDRQYLNWSEEKEYDDPSSEMSEEAYIEYHKVRFYFLNDIIAIYKNRDVEISFLEENNICYFVFKKEIANSKKWLLDNVEVCPSDDEESYDNKIIGEYRPIEYFYPN